MPPRRVLSRQRLARRALLVGAAGLLALLSIGPRADERDPAQNYLLYCSGCHMEDGRGSAPNRVPTFAGSLGHFMRTAEGRAFLVQVGGVAQSPLGDAAIADLLNWLVVRFGGTALPKPFAPYSVEEVRAQRNNRPADLAAARARIAESLRAQGHSVVDY
jgi:mono/diheme cytochrome c family protein